MKKKYIIGVIVVIILAAALIFYVRFAGLIKNGFDYPAGGNLSAPDVNPVDKTNPFSNLKTNPFE